MEDPYLYRLRTALYLGDELVDEYDTPFGIRSTVWDAERGFLLNGEQVKINGVCLHHDAGCVGAAVPDRVLERRLELLKAMGCNGIRCSHYPPAPELLDMADRMGFLVMDEAFDEWAPGTLRLWLPRLFRRVGHARSGGHALPRPQPSLHRALERGQRDPRAERASRASPMLQQLVDVVHRVDPTAAGGLRLRHIDGPDAFDGPTQEGFVEPWTWWVTTMWIAGPSAVSW